MTSPSPSRPTSRYGADRTPKKPGGIGGKIIAVLTVVLIAGIVITVGRFLMNREAVEVSASLVTFESVDDDSIRLWVDVTREDTTKPSYCIVTALNYAMAEVGRREIVLPTGGEGVQRLEVDLPTRDVPVSGGIYGCSTIMPAHLDTTATTG